ncbi:11082_t:CDS:2, partial [Gigaspora rosea]
FQSQIKNIISTSFIGAGDVKDFMDLFKEFQSKSEDEGNSQGIAANNQASLLGHMHNQTKLLKICLLSNISDMISIQLIISKISEKISKNEKQYKRKIYLKDIIKQLIQSNEGNEQSQKGCRKCLSCSNIIKYLELLAFVILVPFYFFHGLMSLNLEVKRISMGNDKLDGVNRVLYGLPLEGP